MNSVFKFLKIVANILKVDFTLESRFQLLLEKSNDLAIRGYIFSWLQFVGVK